MVVRSSRMVLACGALVVLPIAASSGTVANTMPRVAEHAAMFRSHPTYQARRRYDPDCTTDGTGAFVGAGSTNVAGGLDAAVMAGSENQACDNYSGTGTGSNNTVYGDGGQGASESFIAGGDTNEISANNSFDGAGETNSLDGPYAFIGAGDGNRITNSADNAGIGSGSQNSVQNDDSFIAAGNANTITGGGSFIGAGGEYTGGNQVRGLDSFVGSGDVNVNSGQEAFIGDGNGNTITAAGEYAGILSGNNNYASGTYGAIGGGGGNKVEGAFSMIPGGADNVAAGAASFAAGYHADAAHNGSFVWSDNVSGSKVLTDTNVDQFVVRATGGTFIYSSETLASGVKLASGSGTWASLSDRNAKTKISALDDASILAKVDALPVSAWEYKTESGVRHVGPMAQDFYAAFGVGEDDRHITSIDEDGVALAAIKGLDAKLGRKQAEIGALQRENLALHDDNAALHRDNIALYRADRALRSTVDGVRTELTTLEAKVEKLESKRPGG